MKKVYLKSYESMQPELHCHPMSSTPHGISVFTSSWWPALQRRRHGPRMSTLSCSGLGKRKEREQRSKEDTTIRYMLSRSILYHLYYILITSMLFQVMKILENKSVRGLSVVAFELEVVGYTISLAYCLDKKLPFSAFGELVFLLIQALILVACGYYFTRRPLPVSTWVRGSEQFCTLLQHQLCSLVGLILWCSKFFMLPSI